MLPRLLPSDVEKVEGLPISKRRSLRLGHASQYVSGFTE